jgi:hypothetical protein
MATYQFQSSRLLHTYTHFIEDEMYKDRDEILVLTALLPDPINTYLDEFREGIVSTVDGKKVRNLRELSAALAERQDQYVVEFEGIGRPVVFQRADVEAARERIRKRYNVLREQFLGEDTK